MMRDYPGNSKKGGILAASLFMFAVFVFCDGVSASEGEWKGLYAKGLEHHRNRETEKVVECFKEALSAVFPEPADGKFKKGEKALRGLFDDTKTAARARYELGLIYDSQGRKEAAGILFRDALAIVSSKNARYLGYKDGCKSCHFKEWKSWKETKMATAFEVLRPGEKAEEKVKLKFDPKKDYTEDPNCLDCHTTGYGLPGGYHIPRNARYKVKREAEQAEGGTCEACHGPGSVYGPIHEDIDDKARLYTQEELYAAGEYKVDENVCKRCHNRRNPAAGADFHFNFKEYEDKDSHENFELLYRKRTARPSAAAKSEVNSEYSACATALHTLPLNPKSETNSKPESRSEFGTE